MQGARHTFSEAVGKLYQIINKIIKLIFFKNFNSQTQLFQIFKFFSLFKPLETLWKLWKPGKNVANPIAMLLCSAKLLRHINLHTYSDMITNAIFRVLKANKIRTKDLGGQNTTNEITLAVIANLK